MKKGIQIKPGTGNSAVKKKAAIFALFLCCLWILLSSSFADTTETRHFDNMSGIDAITVKSSFQGYSSAVNRPLTDGEPAYDYSAHLIKDGNQYRLYSGGRWRVSANGTLWDGDHVLQHISSTGAANTWTMPHTPQRPEFLKGEEEGVSGKWYSRNYLEPEVVKVNGTYYMFTQVMILPGDPIDETGKTAVTQADRIQLHTSADGLNWSRWSTTRGVIINTPTPGSVNFHHQEVIYVPWDADGKKWWMYVGIDINNAFTGHWRIRSGDPATFDFAARESTWLAQLGNQIAYIPSAGGKPLFVRITFDANGSGILVPTLQFSRDGLVWSWGLEGPFHLEGSNDLVNHRNCYFLGISTIDGTGELEKTGDKYKAFYAATTSNTSVAPEIFSSEIGVGSLELSLEGNLSAKNWNNLE